MFENDGFTSTSTTVLPPGTSRLVFHSTVNESYTDMFNTATNTSTQEVPLWIYTDQQKQIAYINNIVYYSILIPLALCGNIFTLTAVVMVLKIKKSIPNLLIGVLASADLMSLLGCHVISIMGIQKGIYPASKHWCNFQSMMAYTYFKLGFFTKCNISLDRYIALAYPLRYRTIVTTRRVVLQVIINIIFAFGTSALTLYFDPDYIKQIPIWHMCTNDWAKYSEYKLAIVILEGTVFFLGVGVFMLGNITVISVMFKLNRKARRLTAMGKLASSPNSGRNSSVSLPTNPSLKDLKEMNNNGSITPLRSRVLQKLASQDDSASKLSSDDEDIHTSSYEMSKGDNKEFADAGDITLTINGDSDSTHSMPNGNATRHASETSATLSAAQLRAIAILTTKEVTSSGSIASNGNGTASRRSSIWNRAFNRATDKVKAKTRKQSRQKKELQFAKLVMVIVTVFVILWIPFMCVIYYEHHKRENLHPLIEDIAIKLVFANACVNPILYGVFNANFRKAYVYYIRMMCFYLTCKMTKKPSVNERRSNLTVVFEKAQLAARFSREVEKSFTQTAPGSHLLSNKRRRSTKAFLSKSNSLPVQPLDPHRIQEMFNQFKKENENTTATVIDSSIMRLAMSKLCSKSNFGLMNEKTEMSNL